MQLSEKRIMDPLGEWEVTHSLHNKKNHSQMQEK